MEEDKKPIGSKIDVLIVGMGHIPMGAGKVELIESLMKEHNVEMIAFDDPRLKEHKGVVLDEARLSELVQRPPMMLEVPIHEVKRIEPEPTSGRENRNKRRKDKRTKKRRY